MERQRQQPLLGPQRDAAADAEERPAQHAPAAQTRTRPVRSTTNNRRRSPGGCVTYTGWLKRPSRTRRIDGRGRGRPARAASDVG